MKPGARCGCPSSWDERRMRARSGRGPRPHARVLFRFPNLPDAGVFEFATSSWDFAESLNGVMKDLGSVNERRAGAMEIDAVEFTTPGRLGVSYCRPLLKILTR
ncbi:hypothetical protein AB0D10_35655 [Kitasatospora sp. NPDC048545]|uniref:recombination directionality factor n=1 Tax=Kitasatospora sp. NPDC048545 TaxID=3157208 RepID=UPI0033FBBC17